MSAQLATSPLLLDRPVAAPRQVDRLDAVDARRRVEVLRLDEACHPALRRRLLDLGITRGATIEPELDAPFDGLRAYRVRNTLIALRHDQARMIWVRPGSAN